MIKYYYGSYHSTIYTLKEDDIYIPVFSRSTTHRKRTNFKSFSDVEQIILNDIVSIATPTQADYLCTHPRMIQASFKHNHIIWIDQSMIFSSNRNLKYEDYTIEKLASLVKPY